MKRFTKAKLLDTDVAPKNPHLDGWEKPVPKESPQTIRNISRIEQLEAGYADQRKIITQIINYLGTSQLTTTKPWFHVPHISWQDILDVNIAEMPFDLDEGVIIWQQTKPYIQLAQLCTDRIESPYDEKLSTIAKLFVELKEDFDDITRRLTRCAVLGEELVAFENSLQSDETEYLASCVSLISDVLDYNYAEDLTQAHLDVLKKAMGVITEKGLECSKADYKNLHKEFLQSGLALLPTSRKAIEKYKLSKANGGQ